MPVMIRITEDKMKHLKINIGSFRIKGDADDMDTLKEDVYEKIQAMLESDALEFSIDDENEDEDDES